jgi:hypothetical protein
MNNVFEYGDSADDFFIILRGVVSVQIPNPSIVDNAVKRKDYEALLEWKKNIFDPRVEISKK